MNNKRFAVLLAIVSIVGLTGCGGGGGGGGDDPGTARTSYKVGGSVVGLLTPGLELELNGSETLPISANGAFTFTSALPVTDSFNVSVKSHPASDVTCVVTGGSGSFTDDDVSSVRVTCGFNTAVRLDDLTSESAMTPRVAIDGSGNALAVWSRDGFARAMVARYDAVTGWGPAEYLEPDSVSYGTVEPVVAMNQAGTGVAVWLHTQAGKYTVKAKRYSGGWGSDVSLSAEVDDARSIKVATNASGDILVSWVQCPASFCSLWATSYSAIAGTWGTATSLETSNRVLTSSLAISANGQGLASWLADLSGPDGIFAKRFVPGAGWDAGTVLCNSATNLSGEPQAALDDNGNGMVLWEQTGDSTVEIIARRYVVASNTWASSVVVSMDQTSVRMPSAFPQVKFASDGSAFAVWEQADLGYRIWARQYDSATGWGEAELVQPDDDVDGFHPALSVSPAGKVVVVWSRLKAANVFEIWEAQRVAGKWVSTAIDAIDANTSEDAAVAINDAGDAIAVWKHSDGSVWDIWANRF